ncbi:MAG: hypothetical protein GXY67_05235 [Clostridiales bacterium]|nr:hypothetical protein [Clostridiales bacterium]
MKSRKSLVFDFSIIILALGHAMEVSQVLKDYYVTVRFPWMMAMLVLMLCNILTLSAPLKHIFIYYLFISIGVYESVSLGRNWILYLSYILFFIWNKDIDHIVKLILCCTGIVYWINVSAFVICYLLKPGMLTAIDGVRYNLFCWQHPNQGGRQFIFCSMMYIYLHFHQLNWRYWAGTAVAATCVYFFTRSDAVVVLAIPYIAWLLKDTRKVHLVFRFFTKYGILLILPVSFTYFALDMVPALRGVYNLLDKLTTGRMTLGAQGVKLYGITWFGVDMTFKIVNGRLLYVDNAYLYMFVYSGAFFILPLAFIFALASKKLEYRGLVLAVVYILYGFIETGIFDMFAYPAIMVAMHSIYKKNAAVSLSPLRRCAVV